MEKGLPWTLRSQMNACRDMSSHALTDGVYGFVQSACRTAHSLSETGSVGFHWLFNDAGNIDIV
jgi:hypothetical protein